MERGKKEIIAFLSLDQYNGRAYLHHTLIPPFHTHGNVSLHQSSQSSVSGWLRICPHEVHYAKLRSELVSISQCGVPFRNDTGMIHGTCMVFRQGHLFMLRRDLRRRSAVSRIGLLQSQVITLSW